MPFKGGALTPAEQTVAQALAETGSTTYARQKARISAPHMSKLTARPAVQAEIARIQTELLFTEALPAAVQCLVSIIRSDKAPAGARVQAAKVVLDRTLGSDEAGKAKEASEMTPDELAREIEKLTRIASDRAKQVIDVEPNPTDIFE
jgi:hypothetical protein